MKLCVILVVAFLGVVSTADAATRINRIESLAEAAVTETRLVPMARGTAGQRTS